MNAHYTDPDLSHTLPNIAPLTSIQATNSLISGCTSIRFRWMWYAVTAFSLASVFAVRSQVSNQRSALKLRSALEDDAGETISLTVEL
jgi:hypothetical protein